MKTKKVKSSEVHLQFLDETKVHPALKEYFGYCLAKSAARLKSIYNEALKKHNIQSHHLGILKILEVSGPISQIEVGAELGVDKASMVKCIDYLEKNGFVERKGDLKDRRIKNVNLTSKGTKLLKNCVKTREEVEARFLQNLNADEQKTIRKLISLLLPDKTESKNTKS